MKFGKSGNRSNSLMMIMLIIVGSMFLASTLLTPYSVVQARNARAVVKPALTTMAPPPLVTVWADTNANGGPGLNGDDHTITFGPGNQNLFLSQDGHIYSTTGRVGSTPGSFTCLGNNPDCGIDNEGSAFLSLGNSHVLYVGSEDAEEAYAINITGTGNSVVLGSATILDGEAGDSECGDTGESVEFDEAEGVAILNGTPRFDDGTPFFAAVAPSVPKVKTSDLAQSFPLVNANWSGKTLLITNEEDENLVALMILNDGTVDPDARVALAECEFTKNPDTVSVTADGKFAYVHNESDVQFFRFDLQHVDSTGGSNHINTFEFDQAWNHDPMVLLGSSLFAVGKTPSMLCTVANSNSLFQMSIAPMTGDLGSPVFAGEITDGHGNTATGGSGRLATDGTCLYLSDSDTDLIFQICFGSSFDTCLKDDATGNLFQWNSVTGDYKFTRCKDGFMMTGKGIIPLPRNGIRMVTDSKSDRRVSAGYNLGQKTGSATIYLLVGPGSWQVFRINSTNPNAVCTCPL